MLLMQRGKRAGLALKLLAVPVAGLLLLAPAGCAKPLQPEECDALLEHYVSLLTTSDRPGTSEVELLRLKASAREKAALDPAFQRCSSEVPRRKFECAMQAPNADRLEQCML